MNAFTFILGIATFLSSLMAGFLFAFAVVVMPGINTLSDRDYLLSFRAIDRIIQNGQPLFMMMWLGSTASLIVAAGYAIVFREGIDRGLLVAAALASVFLVQLPTMRINIPLNNQVQALEIDSLEDAEARRAREDFEPAWNRWNNIRTVVSCAILLVLILVIARK